MSKKYNSKVYTPKLRTGYSPKKSALISYGKDKKNFTRLPSTVTDDIVVNNISCMEFDYIYDPIYDSQFEEEEDISD